MQPSDPLPLDQMTFRKSSYSQSEAACVEVADLVDGSAIRDTKHRDLSILLFPASEWQAFLGTARNNLS